MTDGTDLCRESVFARIKERTEKMALQLLTGASGHGKTYILYERLIAEATAHPDRKYLLIVPEQSSMQAQKNIVRMHPDHSVFNIDVLTFGRLEYRVFEELGVTLREIIDETGKNLILRKVLGENAKRLKLLQPGKKQGFVSAVKSMISELKQYAITPDVLAEITASLPMGDRLFRKLTDLHMIYTAFEEALGSEYMTAEDKPEVLIKILTRSAYLKDSIVAFDGFTGFTPVQYRLLEQLLGICSRILVTVTLPEDVDYRVISDKDELFFMSKDMIARCAKTADRAGVVTGVERLETDPARYRFHSVPELDFLERNLFRYNGKTYNGDCKNLLICCLEDVKEELRYISASICGLVREEGFRYREIAVVTGDMQLYGNDAAMIFREAGIPYFMDQKRSILDDPLVEYIRSAVSAVVQDASYESMFRFLKSGLCAILPEDVDFLENYVLALGIRGSRVWRERFVRPYPGKKKDADLLRVNEIRERVMEILSPFFAACRQKNQTAAGYVRAVYALMEQAGAYERMESLGEQVVAEQEKDPGAMAKKDAFSKSYGQVIGLLDRIEALLAEETLSAAEFSDMLDAGFDEMRVGMIPPTADCITMGDLERTRLEHIKALYVIGVNEGIIPKLSDGSGILSERERDFLQEQQVELAPTARERIFMQNYYLYLNLTEPEQKLYLTYHRTDQDGKECRASRIIHMIRKMFPRIQEQDGRRLSLLHMISGVGNAMHYAADITRMEQSGEEYETLLIYLWNRKESREIMERMLRTRMSDESEDRLTKEAANRLYEELRASSVSRIEQYAQCAFMHFAEYGLELSEREIYSLDMADVGTVFHRTLQLLGGRLKDGGRSFADLEDAERKELIRQCMAECTVDFKNSFFLENETNAYRRERMVMILERTVWALGEQLKAGTFLPEDLEKQFRFQSGGIDFSGVIDRVDLAQTEDAVHVKVIDYKSGKNDLKYEEIYAGLQLQLLVYLKDVLNTVKEDCPGKQIVAAAAFYNRIDDPFIEYRAKETHEESKERLLRELRPTGILANESIPYLDETMNGNSRVIPAKADKNGLTPVKGHVQTGEHLRLLADFATDKMQTLTQEILDGRIAANPYKNSCLYCPYRSVCRIDWPGHETQYRKTKKLSDEQEIWKLFGKETES